MTSSSVCLINWTSKEKVTGSADLKKRAARIRDEWSMCPCKSPRVRAEIVMNREIVS